MLNGLTVEEKAGPEDSQGVVPHTHTATDVSIRTLPRRFQCLHPNTLLCDGRQRHGTALESGVLL